MKQPVPNSFDDFLKCDTEDPLPDLDSQSSPRGYPSFASLEPKRTEPVAELDDRSKRNLESMISNSCLSVKPSFKFQMPWERKGMSEVFGKKLKLIPDPVMQVIDSTHVRSDLKQPGPPLPSDRNKRGAFSEVIDFSDKCSQQERDGKANRQALEKWYLIFASGGIMAEKF